MSKISPAPWVLITEDFLTKTGSLSLRDTCYKLYPSQNEGTESIFGIECNLLYTFKCFYI